MLVAGFGQVDRALLLVDVVILAHQLRDEGVDADIEAGAILRRTGNDQRRARLVDQDRIDFVDDGEVVAALDHLRHVVFHVVAQIVEAEFVVGAVGDVGGIGLPPLVVVESMHDDADAHAEEAVDLSHPLGVAAGEIIVDGDDVHAFAGERVQIDRQGGDERLAFAGAHLGDGALVQAPCRRSAARRNAVASTSASLPRAPRRTREPANSSRLLPAASSARKASVLARNCSSLRAANSGSSALIAATFGPIALQTPIVRRAEHFLKYEPNISDLSDAATPSVIQPSAKARCAVGRRLAPLERSDAKLLGGKSRGISGERRKREIWRGRVLFAPRTSAPLR